MDKCKICNKYIPFNSDAYEEYYVLNLKIKENENKKNIKYYFFKKLLKNMEENLGVPLCLCNEDKIWKIKEKELEKILKKKATTKKEEDNGIFKNNFSLNVIKNKLTIEEFKNLIQEERKLLNFKFNYTFLIISYSDLIDKLKKIYENKNFEELETIKNLKLLVIYSFEELFEDKKEEFYFYDEKIKDIIEYRYFNNLTTYIIYNAKNTTKFTELIKKINKKELKEFYLKVVKEEKSFRKQKNKIYIF